MDEEEEFENKRWLKLKKELKELKKILNQKQDKIDSMQKYEDEGSVLITIPPVAPMPFKFQHLHYTYIKLSEAQYYEDKPEMFFDKVILITRRPFEKEFHFSNLELLLGDGAQVTGQSASAWFVRLAYTPDDIPILYCCFSERDVEEKYLDLVVSAQDIVDIEKEVLSLMYRHMLDNYKRMENKIKTAEAYEKNAMTETVLLQKKIETEISLARNTTQRAIESVRRGHKLKTWQVILLGLGWVFFVLTGAILLGVLV